MVLFELQALHAASVSVDDLYSKSEEFVQFEAAT